MAAVTAIIAVLSILLFAQSLFSLYLMLYSWEHPERLAASRGPTNFLPPRLSFSVLLPARHEEAVIHETIGRVIKANYPADLLEVAVICEISDEGTIAEVERAIRDHGSERIRLETFAEAPINKPHGLNVGFNRTSYQVVSVFDAEDDIDPDIFNVINTVMLEEETGIVQAGVQLMNAHDHWFSIHNCLEYFFWFKSRLHFHAKVGMIPLGGNTVFMRRELVKRAGGWDEHCLTEDADIGLRLSLLCEPIRVVYDAQHVTREETPATTVGMVRQRTRWHQGYIQVLRKGDWMRLPHFGQRLLAAYTLSYPVIQSLLMLLWPASLLEILILKMPVPIVMLACLPFYALVFQFLIYAVGAYTFGREYDLRIRPSHVVRMAVTFVPFQILLGVGAVRAVYRDLRSQHNWEKTAHIGAHRRPALEPAGRFDRLIDDACRHLGAERASVMLLNRAKTAFFIPASRGLPAGATGSSPIPADQGVASWVIRNGRPTVIDAQQAPRELRGQLHRPFLRSAIVLPIKHQGQTVGVLSVSSIRTALTDDSLRWLADHLRSMLGENRAVTLAVAGLGANR